MIEIPMLSKSLSPVLQPSQRTLFALGLVVWAALNWMWFNVIHRYAYAFPRNDDDNFLEVITGASSDWWGFIWTAGNEHFSPFTRLYFVILAKLTAWNIPFLLNLQVALISTASLFWFFRMGRIMGGLTWIHVAGLMVWMSPVAYETWMSACSYAPLIPLFLVYSVVYLEREWERSWSSLAAMLGLQALVFLMGLMVGGTFLIGFIMATFLLAWKDRRANNRRLQVAAGASALMLLMIFVAIVASPHPNHHSHMRASDAFQLVSAFYFLLNFSLVPFLSKTSLGYFFAPMLLSLCALLVGRHNAILESRWLMLFPAIGFLLLAAFLAYGRANYPPETSRYFIMIAPFWIFTSLAIYSQTIASRCFALVLFVLVTISTWHASQGPLPHYAKEMKERDDIVVKAALSGSPREIEGVAEKIWGGSPERLTEVVRLLKIYEQSIFRPGN